MNPKPRVIYSAPADDDNRKRALEIWGDAKPVTGTIAETYLRNRVKRAFDIPEDIQFHPSCPRGQQRLPALICLLRSTQTNAPQAIQRIFLLEDGSDRQRDHGGKMTLGPATGAVCKLSPDGIVTNVLGITEGVEKGLSIIAAGWSPIWATCGTSGMANFPILPLDHLTVFSDADEAGRKAALTAAHRYAEANRAVEVIEPRIGKDWGDALG